MTIDVEKLRLLCNKATEAPWWISEDDGAICAGQDEDGSIEVGQVDWAAHNVEWLLAARTGLPEALDEIERLQGLLAVARDLEVKRVALIDSISEARQQGLAALETYRQAGKRWVEEKARFEAEQNTLGDIIKRGDAELRAGLSDDDRIRLGRLWTFVCATADDDYKTWRDDLAVLDRVINGASK